MRSQLTMLLAANLAVAAPLALAEEGDLQWSGSVTVGARYVDDDALDSSKLDEYRSLGTGASLWGGFEFRGRSDQGYFNAYGENLGLDNQYLDVRGGAYGTFKYRLYSDEMVHNFGSGPGARSPFTGIGSNVLSATLPNPNVATWQTFDHSYSRRDQGGFVEWQKTSPWYIRFDANEVTRQGVNVFAGANGTSPGNGFTDLPSPIDYTTTNLSGEFGYSGDRSHFAVNLLHSSFSNGNQVLRWNNGFFGNGLDTTLLPADNELVRLGVNGNMRNLFWNSTLSGRLVYSQLTSDVAMQQTMLHSGGVFQASNATPSTFNGEFNKTDLALSLTSRPAQSLDTRLYFDYNKLENKSSAMSFPGTALSGGACISTANPNCSPERYHYERTRLGLEGHYRLSRENKLSGGLEYSDAERERVDFDKTNETRAYVQWKNSSLDSLTTRIKYQFLTRDSEFHHDAAFYNTPGNNPFDFYVRRFDLANVDQNLLKVILDVVPAPLLDLGFEAIYKDNDYKDTILGRTGDQRQEVYASVGYGDPTAFRVLAFGDYEIAKFDSFHRVGTNATRVDPASPPGAAGCAGSACTYNWTGKSEDKSWLLGVGIDWRVVARLSIKGSVTFAKTEGTAEFTPEAGVVGVLAAVPVPFQTITNVDNTKRTALNLKAVYEVDRQWELTGGYAYEKYEYDDIGYTGTLYVTSATNTAGVVTGQYSFQPYDANIIYGMAKYKF